VRGAALDRVARSEKNFKLMIAVAGVLEAAFLLGFCFLADFANRLHVLLLLSTVAVYTLVAAGLFVLGAHVSWCAERVLRAIEAARGPADGSRE
jgi:hypothetical protein